MNKSTLLRTAIAGSVAAAGLSVGGIALATAATEPGTATYVVEHGGRGGPGGRGGGHLGGAELAEALGVSEDKLREALAAVHDELRPAEGERDGTRPTEAEREERRTAMAKALAEELGTTQAKVEAALEKVQQAHRAQRRTSLSERLDQAVEDGDLTAGDKASVLKAYDAGVLGGPGPR